MWSEKSQILKSNYLVEARYKLTVIEQKLIFLLISLIKPTDKMFKSYKITILELQNVLGIKNQQLYTNIKNIIKNLRKKDVDIYTSNGHLLHTGWLSSAEYYNGCVELCFDPKLKPYLLELKEHFTRYYLKDVIQFKSFHSMRMYELIKQYEKIGHRKLDLKELKSMIGLNFGTYPKYTNFRRYVLIPAQKEIQEKTKTTYDFKPIKTGRKVTSIGFYNIRTAKEKVENPKGLIQGLNDIPSEQIDELMAIIDNLPNGTKDEISNIIKSNLQIKGFNYIKSNLIYSFKHAKDNLIGFFIKALANNWGEQKTNKTKNAQKSLTEKIIQKIISLENPTYCGNKIIIFDIGGPGIMYEENGSRNGKSTVMWNNVQLSDIR